MLAVPSADVVDVVLSDSVHSNDLKLFLTVFLPDPASELVISVAGSHQQSSKSTKTCAVAPDTVKQRLDLALDKSHIMFNETCYKNHLY